jgi:uncharacterized repeat protein (TIGR03803 family)
VFKLDTTGKETVLYRFGGGTDGANPFAGLVRDAAGNLYDTTVNGGTSNSGTVFKLATTGKETVLHSFSGAPIDGGLIRDAAGNLYGTTINSGTWMFLWENGKNLISHFIKGQRFNALRLRFLIHRNRPIALKTGVDNLRATL